MFRVGTKRNPLSLLLSPMDMDIVVKQEGGEPVKLPHDCPTPSVKAQAYESSDYCSDSDFNDKGGSRKKRKLDIVLPVGFLDPLSPEERLLLTAPVSASKSRTSRVTHPEVTTLAILDNQESAMITDVGLGRCKQFWKAGDFDDEGSTTGFDSTSHHEVMDHVRVHPRFLHSNATSHKWALGAFAELLDNALDEVCNGATYVQVDVLDNKKNAGDKMILVQDDGGGMAPKKMRQCMSLGYSAKSKMANTIGQYGNGFKTSTMRLGADVIVFSRCLGKDGMSPTQSIGMLSYTFLRKTGKEDIMVPMIDYEKKGDDWRMMVRSSPVDWKTNLETIVQWSPYLSEEDLLQQFHSINHQGTRIIIYNLWEDDQGLPEIDFDSDPHDIQMRGVNREDKNIAMAREFPSCRHFLTYRHSLRSYAAILYLRIPKGFRMILRGKDVEHHNIVDDMMKSEEYIYKPTPVVNQIRKDQNVSTKVTIGFVNDAKHHIDVQGFNVYHKNRLIKPYWRVWNAAGSDGRGVIGVLEADFVEPAHDKQGFESTIVLGRLEQRLIAIQKRYWSLKCHEIGYAKRGNVKSSVSVDAERVCSPSKNSSRPRATSKGVNIRDGRANDKSIRGKSPAEDAGDDEMGTIYLKTPANIQHDKKKEASTSIRSNQFTLGSCQQETCMSGYGNGVSNSKKEMMTKLKEENRELKQRLEKTDDGMIVHGLLNDLLHEKDRANSLEKEVESCRQKIKELENEQIALIQLLSEERGLRDQEEADLRNKLKDALDTIEELRMEVKNGREPEGDKLQK